MKQYILKASGEKELFSSDKIYDSLLKAGASPELASKTTEEIKTKLKGKINSDKVYNFVLEKLTNTEPQAALKYSLKKAIMKLGPTGYLFEKYTAKILQEYGYTTEVGRIVNGYCVSHEIDVIAIQNNQHFMVECKYHNQPGTRSDIKTALYIYARFLDVERAWKQNKGHESMFHQAWLVTNTKCTSEAIKYGSCMNMRIIAWQYPKEASLEYLIENKKLYPITILPSLGTNSIEKLGAKGILLAKELLKYSMDELSKILSTSLIISQKISEEVNLLFRK
ncbi:restriction endonuclease [bacterium]|nr:restriction endonuclease [bacterium]